MISRFIAVALLLLAPAAAQAQTTPQEAMKAGEALQLPDTPPPPQRPAPPSQQYMLDTNVVQQEAAYAEALKKLTPAQRDELHALDDAFVAAMLPILEVYDTSGKLLFCLSQPADPRGISGNQELYVKSFKSLHAQKIDEQGELWREHSKQARKVSYFDHAMMNQHYAYIESVQKIVAEKMVTQAGAAGAYRQTNCLLLQKTLDDAQKHAEEAALAEPAKQQPETPAAPENPGTGAYSGTLGTPIK